MTAITLISDSTSRTKAVALALDASNVKASRVEGKAGAGPALKVGDRTYSVSGASSLLRYVGRLSGDLYPADVLDGLLVDEVLSLATHPDASANLHLLDDLYAKRTHVDGPFLLGAHMTVADLAVLCLPELGKHKHLRRASEATAKEARVSPHAEPRK